MIFVSYEDCSDLMVERFETTKSFMEWLTNPTIQSKVFHTDTLEGVMGSINREEVLVVRGDILKLEAVNIVKDIKIVEGD